MRKLHLFALLTFVLASCNTTQKSANDVDDLYALINQSQAGDTVILTNGIWTDVQLEIKNSGEENAPIVIMAEDAGKVNFTGNSFISISGDYVVVSGILFSNGSSGSKPVISFRSGDKVANNSRVTSCAISYYNPDDRFSKSSWLELYGKYNRVDHCSFVGKLNAGVTLTVKLNGEENQENEHSIDHNFFGDRSRLGSNGGETMRVGTSTFSLSSSKTKILNNYFKHCNGEVEIISIKSCDNLISANTFYECEGILTLRHGNNNTITNNVFIGNNIPHTGGVRVINAGHTISNNHFQELAGHRFRSAFAVMNGVPNSAINRYHQVKDATFDNNVFINCTNIAFGIGSDNERTAVPQNSTFKNNLIYNPDAEKLVTELDDMSGIEYADNTYLIGNSKLTKPGFQRESMSFTRGDDGIFASAIYQVEQKAREDNTGASWYLKNKPIADPPKKHEVSGDNIYDLIENASANDILLISEDVILSKPLQINKPLSLIGQVKEDENPELRYEKNRDGHPLIRINNGGELTIKNLDLNGWSEQGIANEGIATQEAPAIEHYNLFADHCTFYNFSEGRATAFKAFKSTFADSIVFSSCVFHTISGMGINLKGEIEDMGKYNAEYVILDNCLFYNILGSALNLYRGGNDESTTGPSLQIDRCTFHNIENRELGSAVNLTGVQDVRITNSIFSESGKGGRVIKMEDQQWITCLVEHNNFYKSGRFESFYDKRLGKNNWYLNPDFISAEDHDFNLDPKSPLSNRSTSNNALGYNK